jgi:hypothetical protein
MLGVYTINANQVTGHKSHVEHQNRVSNPPEQSENMPAVAQGPPPEEEELILAESFWLVRSPAYPRTDSIENEHPERADGEDDAQEDIARRNTAR